MWIKETTPKGERRKAYSFYQELFDATKRGTTLVQTIAGIQAAKDGKGDAPDAFLRMGTDAQKMEINRLNRQRTDGRAALVTGFRVAIQMRKCARLLPNIIVKYATKKLDDGTIEPVRTTTPIIIADKVGEGELPTTNLASISTFLSYDVEKAAAAGGKREDLTATASREGGAGQGGPTEMVQRINGPKKLDEYVSELAGYLEQEEGKKVLLKLAASDRGKEFLYNLCIIADVIDSPTSKFQPTFQNMLETKGLDKANKAA